MKNVKAYLAYLIIVSLIFLCLVVTDLAFNNNANASQTYTSTFYLNEKKMSGNKIFRYTGSKINNGSGLGRTISHTNYNNTKNFTLRIQRTTFR